MKQLYVIVLLMVPASSYGMLVSKVGRLTQMREAKASARIYQGALENNQHAVKAMRLISSSRARSADKDRSFHEEKSVDDIDDLIGKLKREGGIKNSKDFVTLYRSIRSLHYHRMDSQEAYNLINDYCNNVELNDKHPIDIILKRVENLEIKVEDLEFENNHLKKENEGLSMRIDFLKNRLK